MSVRALRRIDSSARGFRRLAEGAKVSYYIEQSPKGPVAANVQLI